MRVIDPFDELAYFAEWGHRQWQILVRHAVCDFLGQDLTGLHMLEIGARYARMASFFALLGARVTGVDINEKALEVGRREIGRWGVADRVQLRAYDGCLDIFEDESFDLLFTKSVLVKIPDLEPFLESAKRKLKPGGKVVFIENGRGPLPLHVLRGLYHGDLAGYRIKYFKRQHVGIVQRVFDIQETRYVRFPPIYLFLGRRPNA